MENNRHVIYLIASCFSAYFVISYLYKRLNLINLEGALKSSNGLLLINLKHCLGILLFGVIFFIAAPDYRFLINAPEVPELYTLFLFFIVVFISGFIANKSVRKKMSQMANTHHYGLDETLYYFTLRFIFLFAYEFFFRGVLFFAILKYFDLFIAFLISTSLYVLIHIFDSKKEIIGAIPFGIVLCSFTYFTNSIWIAFIIHITLSGIYEASLFYKSSLKNQIS